MALRLGSGLRMHKEDSRFHMEGGSWSNNISWVRGYERLIGPMEQLSSLFFGNCSPHFRVTGAAN